MSLLDGAGFTSVVATNCEQEYDRDARTSATTCDDARVIESVSEEKTTGLGVGHFVTTRVRVPRPATASSSARCASASSSSSPAPAEAGRAGERPTAPPRPRPAITHDNAFFFEGAQQGKLLIQRCAACGALRHPPGPMCPRVPLARVGHASRRAGAGTVYSFVVNHYPQVPAFDYPLAVGADRARGGHAPRRRTSSASTPADVTVGMPVEVEFVDARRRAHAARVPARPAVGLMDFSLTEEQEAVRDLAEQIFAGHGRRVERVKEVEAGDERIDRDAVGASWPTPDLLGIALPEDARRQRPRDGRAVPRCSSSRAARVAPVPLWPTLVLGALPIAEFGTAEQRERVAARRRRGRAVLTAALAESGANDPCRPQARATRDGGGWRLDGAQAVACPPRTSPTRSSCPPTTDDGVARVPRRPGAARASTREPRRRTDRSARRRTSRSTARRPSRSATPATGERALAWMLDRALRRPVRAAARRVRGGACAWPPSTRRSAQQFGKPLSTFQGVALQAADAYIDTEAMRVTLLAGGVAARPKGSTPPHEVLVAKWWASEGGQRVVHTTQHLHGGMGADVDYPVHRYFLWGKQIEDTLGGASAQLARLGRHRWRRRRHEHDDARCGTTT